MQHLKKFSISKMTSTFTFRLIFNNNIFQERFFNFIMPTTTILWVSSTVNKIYIDNGRTFLYTFKRALSLHQIAPWLKQNWSHIFNTSCNVTYIFKTTYVIKMETVFRNFKFFRNSCINFNNVNFYKKVGIGHKYIYVIVMLTQQDVFDIRLNFANFFSNVLGGSLHW